MKSILRKTSVAGYSIVMYLCILLLPSEILSQSPVLQFTTTYVSASSSVNSYTAYPTNPGSFSSCSSNNYTYTWSNGSNNQLKLISFTANSKTYIVSGIASVQVKLRRVNNANVTGTRNILYSETTAASANSCVTPHQLDFKAPYNDDMASFLNNNILNHGTDNLFTNAANGDDNNNNIERVDVVFTGGIKSSYPADAGFVLCERGNNYAHDGFRIAAILSVNASKNPTSFGPVKNCVAGNGSNNGSWGHPSIANGNKLLAAYVLRKDPTDTYLRVSSNVNQEIGGVFFSFADLGVSANQTIYGYCLIGPDGISNPTSAQLLNTNDATVYPTGTTEAEGGGLDLISVNTFFGTNEALASSLINSFAGTVQNAGTILNWEVNDLPIGKQVILERSEDAISFLPVYSYSSDGSINKSYRDFPGTGTFYYRLQIESGSGSKIVSPVVQLKITEKSQIKVYPTIVKPGESITIDFLAAGQYSISLQSITSAIVFNSAFTTTNGKAVIALPQMQLTSGVYFILFRQKGKQLFEKEKIIIQN